MTRISDLPHDLVGEKILGKVPITSLKAVRSTCKLWKALTKDCILGKAAARQQFLGFMTMDSKVCSVRSDLRGDLVDLSVKQVDILDQVEISKVFHCNGLLLCVAKDLSLLVWNPYLGQTKWIKPRRKKFHRLDRYAIGYDNNHNHKILKFLDDYLGKHVFGYEIYDFSSSSWRVLDVTPDWDIECYHRGVSLKGNTYFFAQEKLEENKYLFITEIKDFLLCFNFTTERFGPCLPLPFHSYSEETVTLSCIREEQLAVLYQMIYSCEILEIWVTTKIEYDSVSWSMLLKVDMRPLTGFQFDYEAGSFFIDEEKKVAVVFDVSQRSSHSPTAFIIGENGYFKSVCLGEALNAGDAPLVCTSYHPSLVQIKQPRKRKARHD